MSASADSYYVPHGTNWPIIGSIGLATTVIGLANYLHGSSFIMAAIGLATS